MGSSLQDLFAELGQSIDDNLEVLTRLPKRLKILGDKKIFVYINKTQNITCDIFLAKNAKLELFILHDLRESVAVNQIVTLHHQTPETTATITAYSVLHDQSKLTLKGLIKVSQGAAETDSYLLHKTLLISDQAVIETRPELEIDYNEVSCSHGATVGGVDQVALQYLQSRGIYFKNAQKLLEKCFKLEICKLALTK